MNDSRKSAEQKAKEVVKTLITIEILEERIPTATSYIYKTEGCFNEQNENTFGNIIGNDSILSLLSNLNINMDTIMKVQRAVTALNQSDPRKNLLMSLKPFLRETRKGNIDTYITAIGIINALAVFGNNGSD